MNRSVAAIEAPAIRQYRRRGLIVALVIISLLGVLPALLVLSYLQIPTVAFPRTVSDANRLVSIDLPAGWYDETGEQRAIVRTDSEGLYIEPDIRAKTFSLSPGRLSYFTVVITLAPLAKTSDQIHGEAVQRQQRDYGAGSAVTRSAQGGSSTAMKAPGQILNIDLEVSDAALVVRTVTTPDFSVTMLGYTDLEDDPDGTKLLALLEAARISQ